MKPSEFSLLNPGGTEPSISRGRILIISVSYSKTRANFTEPLGFESSTKDGLV